MNILIVLAVVLGVFSNSCHAKNQKLVFDSDAVNLTLYYEVLCPDCKEFVSDQVINAFKFIPSIMSLTLVPYGNAKESFNSNTGLWEFTCQHGADECWGNLLHTCVLHYYPKTEQHFPFIYCMESAKSNANEDIHGVATECAKQVNLSIDEPLKCVDSKLGNELQHEFAAQTGSLSPAHNYVPWVTVNGVHTEDIQNKAQADLVKFICDTYTGSNKPDACK